MKKLKIILYSAIFLALIGCDSFVEVDSPASQLPGNIVYSDMNTVNAAMSDVYAKLRDSGILNGQGLGLSYTLGLYADELTYYATTPNAEFNNTMLGTSPTSASIWTNSYKQVYGANAVLEGINNSASLPSEVRNQFRGEALLVRAIVHFYLTNLYGSIPYVKTTDYTINRMVSRMSVESVYENIINDLNEAAILLPEAYITDERVRPNKAVAHALLARVYLYHGNWQQAANEASIVIDNPEYTWDTNLDNIFLRESTTTIWQFKPKLEGLNTNEGSLFIFLTGPPPSVGLSPSFVQSFENGDNRRTHWIKEVTNGTNIWYHAYKYKQRSNTGTSKEYSIVLRLAEQYLIRAEARAMQGEITGAKDDLNRIRNRAGLTDTQAVTQVEVISALLDERRHELFTEFGHRFFDLKRTGHLDNVLALTKPGWDHNDMLWPLPDGELLLNPNLQPQNPGY